MNITKLAADALKLLPKTFTRKQFLIGVAAGLGAGVSTTSLFNCGGKENKIGDDFERQETTEQKADTTEVKQPVDTVPVPTADNYDKVTVGKNGIESADTVYYIGTDKIAKIRFYEDKNKKNLSHEADFDENGKLSEYTWLVPDSKNINGIYTDFSVYDAKDELIRYGERQVNGGWRLSSVGKDEYEEYDKKGDIKHYHTEYADFYYEADGSKKTHRHDKLLGHYIEYEDKNGRLLKKKVLDNNDVLKYTVVPKYDKEGTLIKNDTIKNQK